MSKTDKRKYTLKYFNEKIKTNIYLQNNYTKADTYFNNTRIRVPYIIGYKQIKIENIPKITHNNYNVLDMF